jgi:hypothetical protein
MHWIDHDFLPAIAGTVERFIINPKGEIDGLVLMYDRDRFLLVHVPPHLDPDVESLIKRGDKIHVRGLRPRGADMVAAVSLTAADGTAIVDNGPDHASKGPDDAPEHEPSRIEIAGIVRMSLYGPKGDLRGALLEDGSIVRIGPKEAAAFADLLRPRAGIAVRGEGIETPHGRAVAAKEIGTSFGELRPVKKLKHHPEHEGEDEPEADALSVA